MAPNISGRIINGVETFKFAYPCGCKKVIKYNNAADKITVETFVNAAAEKAGNPYKVKTLNYSPVMNRWIGTTRYTEPAQYVCYDIQDGVVKGAHLDTARDDIAMRLTKISGERPVADSNARDWLNYLMNKIEKK